MHHWFDRSSIAEVEYRPVHGVGFKGAGAQPGLPQDVRQISADVRRRLAERARRFAIKATAAFAGPSFDLRSTPAVLHESVRKGYEHEDQARRAIGLVREFTQLSYERLVTLYGQVAYLEKSGIQGALVECGVWRGGASAMMALANLATGAERRHLHLFDSFQGMPEPRAEVDGAQALAWTGSVGDGSLRSTGANVADAAEVRAFMLRTVGYPEAFLHIHAGWFQDTLPRHRDEIGPIALLRLDGDWYDSTRVTFENLYDSVVTAGVVVIDDYGHFEGCRRATDEFLAARREVVYLGHIDYTGRYFIKPASGTGRE